MNISKFKKITLAIILLTLMNACYGGPYFSPSIKYQNSSKNCKIIKNIQVNWNGYQVLGTKTLGIGGGSSRSEYIKNFLGPVHVSWEDEGGKKMEKIFEFTRSDMHSYKENDHNTGNRVILFFSQTDMQYLSSDHPNFKKEYQRIEGDWFYHRGKCYRNGKKKWNWSQHKLIHLGD